MKIRWVSRAFFVVAISACAVDDTAGPPQLGAPIPGYTAATLEGDSVSLSSLRGEVVLLNLWATWCAPCRKETPFLQELFEEHQEEGLHLVGVSLDTGAATEQVERFVEDLNDETVESQTSLTREVSLPVCYENEFGLDLGDVAEFGRCAKEEVIRLHTTLTYRVYMLGFQPGFAYLGSVNAKIASPRRKTPRIKVPAGSVGIAGRQTGVYPCDSPGGWQIIGRCPTTLVDWSVEKPFLLRAGDSVKFEAVDRLQYDSLLKESK